MKTSPYAIRPLGIFSVGLDVRFAGYARR